MIEWLHAFEKSGAEVGQNGRWYYGVYPSSETWVGKKACIWVGKKRDGVDVKRPYDKIRALIARGSVVGLWNKRVSSRERLRFAW